MYARIQQYEETSRCDGSMDEDTKAVVEELHPLAVASGPATAVLLQAQVPPPPALPTQTAAVEVLDERETGLASPDISITTTAETSHPLISTG